MSEQRITKNTMVEIDYRLSDTSGSEIDASEEPLQYLHGHGHIVPGLEKALEGRATGDDVEITVDPNEGYGEHDPAKVFTLERERLQFPPQAGGVVQASLADGRSQYFMITEVGEAEVTLDGNHPLAGKQLRFEVSVRSVRDATPEEVAKACECSCEGN